MELSNHPTDPGSITFCDADGDDSVTFIGGELSATAYSYEIAGVGEVSLTHKQTYQLFLEMQEYYQSNESVI